MRKYFGSFTIDNSALITVQKNSKPVQQTIVFPDDFDRGYQFIFQLISNNSLGFYAEITNNDLSLEDEENAVSVRGINGIDGIQGVAQVDEVKSNDSEEAIQEQPEKPVVCKEDTRSVSSVIQGVSQVDDMKSDDSGKGVRNETAIRTENEITVERRAQVLQLLLNSILSGSGLKYINFPGSRGWFPCNSNSKLNVVLPVYQHSSMNMGVLRGIKASLSRSNQGLALKVSNQYRLLQSQSLQQQMGTIFHSNPNPQNYKNAVRRLLGRKALYLPTQTIVEIDDIDVEENEVSTFTRDRGGKSTTISYKDNLLNLGHAAVVDREPFGIVKNERGFGFLPQFMYLLFNADRDRTGPMQRKEALRHLAENRDLELKSVQMFIDHIVRKQQQSMVNAKDVDKSKDHSEVDVMSVITISRRAIHTAAYPLPQIGITIKGTCNKLIECTGSTISKNWREIHGLQMPVEKARKALIVGERDAVQIVQRQINGYFKRRKFGCKIVSALNNHFVDPREISNVNFVDRLKHILKKGQYGLLILIVPNVVDGSKLKRAAHRKCLELGVTTQFMFDEVCRSGDHKQIMNTVWSMMADVIYKLGGSAYSVNPNLKTGNLRINVSRTLMMGLDICHPTRMKNGSTARPSIAVLTSFYGNNRNNILTPNIKQQKSAMFLNPNRQEVCSFESVKAMTVNVLKQQLLRKDVGQLPLNVLMLRDGVSDSQIEAMISNELSAVMAAVQTLQKDEKLKRKYRSIGRWRPNFEWIVCQKRILDRFSPKRNEHGHRFRLHSHTPSFIVPSDVVSGEYFEYYYQIGTRSPTRMLVVKDEMGMKNGGLMDLAQFIDATHWLYPPSIPFVCGQLSYPAPIKVADHHANNWQEMIGREDCSIDDIKSSDKLPNPQLVRI